MTDTRHKPLHPCVEALMALAYGQGEECLWCIRMPDQYHGED